MGKIVVGVDGSEGSRVALRWARAEARFRSCPLEVVAVWQYPTVQYPMMGIVPSFSASPEPTDLRDEAERALRAVLEEESIASDDAVAVSILVAEGASAPTLLAAAADADLLVVGSRGHGGFTGLLIGSVSQQCVTHAPCPVVVVPA